METLAVKYRPKTFDDVVEQGPIKLILMKQLESETHKNAYLFTGGAGTGKTTCARIFANELNGGKGNPIEIDAASNNGVENVRDIVDKSSFKSLDAKYKTYIIDECHMLSTGAWNALLKVLEEPPAQTVFIFCTTDPQKIPATILSRVQRYDFQRIKHDSIVERLQNIIGWENDEAKEVSGCDEDLYTYDNESVEYIAKMADGGMRDAITLLDKCLSYNEELNIDNAVKALGAVNYEVMFDLMGAIIDKNMEACIEIIESIHRSGADLKQFVKQFNNFILDLVKYYLFQNFNFIKIPSTYADQMEEFLDYSCIEILDVVLELQNQIKWETDPKPLIEARFILLCQ